MNPTQVTVARARAEGLHVELELALAASEVALRRAAWAILTFAVMSVVAPVWLVLAVSVWPLVALLLTLRAQLNAAAVSHRFEAAKMIARELSS